MVTPSEYVGAGMELCQRRRGTHVEMHYLSPERVQLGYELPLAEIVLDFYDQLKSGTRGYARWTTSRSGCGRRTSSSSTSCSPASGSTRCRSSSTETAPTRPGKALVDRLQRTIPRQLFDVPVQAAIGSRVLARETVKALRKDVTAKLYGGDVTRKRKLLEKQKAGKKRMKQVGQVEVPQEAFLAVLELDGRKSPRGAHRPHASARSRPRAGAGLDI